MRKLVLHIIGYLFAFTCSAFPQAEKGGSPENIQIAFLSDIHIQDPYALQSTACKTDNDTLTPPLLIKTMDAQLHSTRLFNENYFAFIATLDDIVKRNIHYVVIAGDLTDDGQEANSKSVLSILERYKREHKLNFFITSGNHDVIAPAGGEYASKDFLSADGQPVYFTSSNLPGDTDTASFPCLRTIGYSEMQSMFADYGFLPKKQYRYWESPFTEYTYEAYAYEKAQQQAAAPLKMKTDGRQETVYPFDLSYLVEPVPGLWLLAIDANVFVPSGEGKYKNLGGYNDVFNHKKYLLPWIKKVAAEARRLHKRLICFSHYPMIDYTNGSFTHLKACNVKMNFSRIPQAAISEVLADAGIDIHFGGHMHLNNTGFVKTASGNTLYNIQLPSLAAYMPGYKVLTITNEKQVEIKTIHMDTVPSFKELMPIYEKELKVLESTQSGSVWQRDILDAKNYRAFTRHHLSEVVRMRFIPSEYPAFVKDTFAIQTGKEALLQLGYPGTFLSTKLLKPTDTWTGFDYILDFYRILNGGKQAITEIGEGRMNEYNTFNTLLMQNKVETEYGLFLKHFARAFDTLLNGLPTDKVDIQPE